MARRVDVPAEDRAFYAALQKVRGRRGACVQNLNAHGDAIQILYDTPSVRDELARGAPTRELALISVLSGYGALLSGQEARRFQAIFNLGEFSEKSHLNSLERRLDDLGDDYGLSETRKNDADSLTRAVATAFRTMHYSPCRNGAEPDADAGPAHDWERLVDAMLQADSVKMIGVAPLPLLDVLQSRRQSGEQAPNISYYTSPSESLASAETTGAPLTVQLWNAAIIGLRNLLKDDRADDAVQRYQHFAYTVDHDLGGGCIILCEGDHTSTWIATPLPSAERSRADYVLSRPVASSTGLIESINNLVADAAPLIIRQVACGSGSTADAEGPKGFPIFPVKSLSPYGTTENSNDGITQPVAVSVLRADLPDGSCEIILKCRSVYTDTSDFGIYSLLSARIQEGDLAKGLDVTVPPGLDAATALERMWIAASSPRPFRVPIKAFLAAAQRDVFATAGLQVSPERFELGGSHFGKISDDGHRLGFVAFLVQLVRTEAEDELATALEHGHGYLRRIRPAELLDGSIPMNRILKAMPTWLADCLKQDATRPP